MVITTSDNQDEGDDLIQRNVRESMQTQVENYIRRKIGSGTWTVGTKIPSERELTEQLDVSRTTVRNAVQALTQEGYFERKIGQGTFVRGTPPVAAVPRTAATGNFGFVICKARDARKPLSSEAFYFDVFSGIEEETVKAGRHVLFTYLDDRSPSELETFGAFLDKVDGVVVEEAGNPDLLSLLVARGTPAVLLAPSLADPRLDLVTMDLGTGAAKAVESLLDLGHRAIGIINGPLDLPSAADRYEGWRRALQVRGVVPQASWVAGDRGWTAEAGTAAMDDLLNTAPELTAVFCANDLLAIGALAALTRRGLAVPADLSLVGFDDTELARHASPALTTMRIHSRSMARTAVRRLAERLDDPALPPVTVGFPIDLVARGSTARLRNLKEGGV